MNRKYKDVALSLVRSNDKGLNVRLVKGLVKSIENDGLIVPITVNRAGSVYNVIHGHHRMAALRKIKARSVACIIEPAPKSADILEAKILAENVVRNQITGRELDKAVRRLVAIWTAIHSEGGQVDQVHKPLKSPNKKSLSRKTPKGKAIESVAETTGKTKEAVRSAAKRADRPAPRHPPVATEYHDGNRVAKPMLARWEMLHGNLTKVDGLLRRVQAHLEEMSKTSPELGPKVESWVGDRVPKWHRRAHELAHEIRSNMPHALCPRCRGGGCKVCDQIGLVSKRRHDEATR